MIWALLLILLLGSTFYYFLGKRKALLLAGGRSRNLKSRPNYYGVYALLWSGLPAIVVLCVWLALDGTVITHITLSLLPEVGREMSQAELGLFVADVRNLVDGNAFAGRSNESAQQAAEHYKRFEIINQAALAVVTLIIAVLFGTIAMRRIRIDQAARVTVERALKAALIFCSTVAIFTTIGIVLSVLFESIRFFRLVPLTEFFFGTQWSPQLAIREDQVGSSGAFGAIPVFTGTLMITLIAMLVAVPIGLLSAIYLSEYATPRFRMFAKPILEILAGVPTVVYGFFAALTVAPFLRGLGDSIGISVSSESALAAGVVMGVMIIPFVSSLSDDVINAVPQALRDGSLGLGATRSETVRRVIFPAALPGIVGAILLAVSRAIGETMIVVMAAGLAANLTANPLEAMTTVTVQIVTLLIGDQEFDSAKTLAAFALGLMLFLVTLLLNVIALRVVRRYREQYE